MKAGHSQRELEKRIFHLKTLYDVSQEICFLRNPQEITKNLLLMMMGNFGALSGVALLADTTQGTIEAATQRGMGEEALDAFTLAVESENFNEFKEINGIQTLRGNAGLEPDGKRKIFDSLSSSNINVWIPLKVNESLRGGIGLGDKLTGDPYTRDDCELLDTLSSQGAVAIENARLLEQMKKEEVVRTNLSRYLSPQIVDQVIKEDVQVNLGGHRKVVTVLFSDIRDFTSITETRPPDQLVHLLNEYFTHMARIIFDNQGSLDKYIGDALVAVFGSLIHLDNPARNAVRAAIQMMERMPARNREWMEEYGFSMQIGIGVTTGEVFLGNIGSPERMEYTVIGDTVNIASRFSGLARAGQVLVTRETLNALGHAFEYREHPPAAVKGKAGKLEVFEILY